MKLLRRIGLFLAVNILVVLTVSVVLDLLGARPYLSQTGLDLQSLMIFCLVWGMAGAFISLLLSRVMAKWMLGVKVVDPHTNDPALAKLVKLTYRLSQQAGLAAMPEVGIFQSSEPNAFATGPSERRSLVAVSTALLESMNEQQLEGVLAHEISHISNGDMVTMTLLQGVINAFVMFLARVLAYAVSSLGKDSRDRGRVGISYFLFVYLFEVVFMILGSIIIAFYSRRREFRADQGGAQLAGRDSMISALQYLQHRTKEDPKLGAWQNFKISGVKKRSAWMQLFSSHPPLEERIARLSSL